MRIYWPLLLYVLLLLWAPLARAAAPPGFGFVPNKGQWPAAVHLRAAVTPGLTVYLEDRQLRFLYYDAPTWAANAHRRDIAGLVATSAAPVRAHAWTIELLGARRKTRPVAVGEAFGPVYNYFVGANPRHWATNLRATSAAAYPNAWPGIRLVAHPSAEGAFEYDLEVQPGAEAAHIQLQYRGLDGLSLDSVTGYLRLQTALGELQEAAPQAWQVTAGGRRVPVPCQFVLTPDGAGGGIVAFKLPAGYDRGRALVIDPVLVAATYSGSTAPTFGHTATYDSRGRLYAAGPCFDPGYPTTVGAFDLMHSQGAAATGSYNNPDVAVSRYSADGRQLAYATYLGGQNADYPHSLLVNKQGDLLILGSTFSQDFPTTTSAYDRQFGGNNRADSFIARLDSAGSRLLSSTYLGGAGTDGLAPAGLCFFYGDAFRGDLAVDSLDRVFVATVTESANFPFSAGAVRPAASFTSTAVVCRLSPDLTTLDWAAGLGTSAAAYGLYVPPSGEPFVVGTTATNGFPATPNSLEASSVPGFAQHDGFVAQVGAAGTIVRAATYLRPGTAGAPLTQAFFVQPDPVTSDVYILGSSTGNYSASPNTWGQAGGGLVVQRLNAALSQRRWTATVGHRVTYGAGQSGIGSNPDTDNLSPTAFLVDNCGAIYLSGWGRTQGLPTTPNALQRTTSSGGIGGDLYLLVLSPDAAALQYASYIGGSSVTSYYEEHVDGGTSRFDPQGRVYQAVCTNAHNFPTSLGAWRPTNRVAGGAYDEVAVKLDFEPRQVRAAAATATVGGQAATVFEAPAEVQFTNGSSSYPGTTTWQWNFGDGTAPSTAFEPQHTYLTPGVFTIQLITTDFSTCATADTAYLQITVLANDSTDYLAYTICPGDSVRFGAIAAVPGSFRWSPATTLSNATALAPVATPNVTTTYAATGQVVGTNRRNTWQVTVTVIRRDSLELRTTSHCLPAGSLVELSLSQPLRDATWDFGDGTVLREPLAQYQTHFFRVPGPYTVRISGRDSHDCPVTVDERVTPDEMYIPNIFTPGTDGVNDTFEVGCLEPGSATLKIYNRWGQMVYDSGVNQYANQWTGAGLAAGVYYYYLRLTYASTPIKGWVEIVR